MSAHTIPLLIAVFPQQEAAGELLMACNDGRSAAAAGIVDAAALVKDDVARLRVADTRHHGSRGLMVGGVVATVIGGLAGPAVATAAGGRVVGGLRGRLRSAPLKFELLALGDELPQGSSLLVSVVDPGWADELRGLLDLTAMLVLTYELRQAVVDELNRGGNVTFPCRANGVRPAGRRDLPARDLPGHGLPGGDLLGGDLPDRDLPSGADAGRAVAPAQEDVGVAVSAARLTDEPLPRRSPNDA